MKVALIGYGKMGQMLDALASAFEIEIVSIIDPDHPKATAKCITHTSLNDAQISIDFSSPDSALNNICDLAALKSSVVVGTTGWPLEKEDLSALAHQNEVGIFFAPNFSIGVYLFTKIIESAAELIEPFDEFDISCEETHHIHKKDAPSGTALNLANSILKKMTRKKMISTSGEPLKKEELSISSKREGNVVGDHKIEIAGSYDQITLSHHCSDRKSFAIGALKASLWLDKKVGFF